MGVTAERVRQVREELGLSRGDIAQATQLSVGRIAGIELGKKLDKPDVELVTTYLSEFNPTSLTDDTVDVDLTLLDTTPGDVILEEWNGIKKGDPVKVTGQARAKFDFLAHVTKTNGNVYVSVIGGKSGRRSLRSFSPDTVTLISRKGKRAKKNKGDDGLDSLRELMP